MKYTTQGNCPYCDADRGVTTVWGMSPEGMASLKERHDQGHPENQPQTTGDIVCPYCHTRITHADLHGGITG